MGKLIADMLMLVFGLAVIVVPIAFIIVVILVATGRVNLRRPSRSTSGSLYPYERCPKFLTNAERSFYEVLLKAVPETSVVMAKVRLGDLIKVRGGTPRYRSFSNRINQKHIDFVICNRATMQPEYCLELDDKSHQRADRVERDDFVDNALDAAGLPIIHVPCKASYNLEELRGQLNFADMGILGRLEAETVIGSVDDDEYEAVKARLRGTS